MNHPAGQPDADWRVPPSLEQCRVLRRTGTGRAFTFNGACRDCHEAGVQQSAGRSAPLSGAARPFDSGAGWPGCRQAVHPQAIGEHDDRRPFMRRAEAACARCGGHPGHVFPDGPRPAGLRCRIHCIALKLEKP